MGNIEGLLNTVEQPSDQGSERLEGEPHDIDDSEERNGRTLIADKKRRV
jgi:hypothetical protein